MNTIRLASLFRVGAAGAGLWAAMAGCGAPPEISGDEPIGEEVAALRRSGSRLVARAVLPADTFAAGPPSGAALGTMPINGRTPPFPLQPVQGFSSVIDGGDGTFLAMPDNGYGGRSNSADFLLRIYRVRPHFATAEGGAGRVAVREFLQLRDPDRRIPFPITRGDSDRYLTGADFDPEAVRRDHRGDLWIGDEFGPFLLHTDATGKVLEAPFSAPGLKSPDSPYLLPGEAPTVDGSSGFEAMAISPDGRRLYPTTEEPLLQDPDRKRHFIFEFDIPHRRYTGRTWQYHTTTIHREDSDDNRVNIHELVALDAHRLLVLEIDITAGTTQGFKRVFMTDLRFTDDQGFLLKREVADLMTIRDPDLISLRGARPGDIGLGNPFSMPFVTIEAALPLPGNRLLVMDDNNYPGAANRNPGHPDDNEFNVIEIPALRGGVR